VSYGRAHNQEQQSYRHYKAPHFAASSLPQITVLAKIFLMNPSYSRSSQTVQ